MHENGAHDYLKFIKFGYGRATDHATKDIRLGYMTREEGIEITKYDHIRLTEDLDRWYKYVNIGEDEFNRVSDTFRDPSVWFIKITNGIRIIYGGDPRLMVRFSYQIKIKKNILGKYSYIRCIE